MTTDKPKQRVPRVPLAAEDPTRFKVRTVEPKRGGGHKPRPRKSNRQLKERG